MTNCVIDNAVPPSMLAQFAEILEAKPDLLPDTEEIWSTFLFLSSHRPSGFGVEAIPPPWLYDACARRGIVGEEQERWVALLSDMDRTFCKFHVDKQKKESEGG